MGCCVVANQYIVGAVQGCAQFLRLEGRVVGRKSGTINQLQFAFMRVTSQGGRLLTYPFVPVMTRYSHSQRAVKSKVQFSRGWVCTGSLCPEKLAQRIGQRRAVGPELSEHTAVLAP